MFTIRTASLFAVVGVCAFATATHALWYLIRFGWADLNKWLGIRINRISPLQFLVGWVAGAVVFGLIFLIELTANIIEIQGVYPIDERFFSLARHGVIWAAVEEIVFRLLALNGLVILLGSRWKAIAISALLFGALHAGNPSASPASLLGNALGGVLYGIAYLFHGTIWLPFGLHVGWNFFQGPVFGFPVSGLNRSSLILHEPAEASWFAGSPYGPEADPLGILFRLLLIATIYYWWLRRERASRALSAAR